MGPLVRQFHILPTGREGVSGEEAELGRVAPSLVLERPKGGLHPGPLRAGVLSDMVTSPMVLINRRTIAEPSSAFLGSSPPRLWLVSPFVSSDWEQGSPPPHQVPGKSRLHQEQEASTLWPRAETARSLQLFKIWRNRPIILLLALLGS